MRIIDDEKVIDFLQSKNNNEIPKFSVQQIQGHIDYKCGCKITQDKMGNSLFPCNNHYNWASEHRDMKILHKNVH